MSKFDTGRTFGLGEARRPGSASPSPNGRTRRHGQNGAVPRTRGAGSAAAGGRGDRRTRARRGGPARRGDRPQPRRGALPQRYLHRAGQAVPRPSGNGGRRRDRGRRLPGDRTQGGPGGERGAGVLHERLRRLRRAGAGARGRGRASPRRARRGRRRSGLDALPDCLRRPGGGRRHARRGHRRGDRGLQQRRPGRDPDRAARRSGADRHDPHRGQEGRPARGGCGGRGRHRRGGCGGAGARADRRPGCRIRLRRDRRARCAGPGQGGRARRHALRVRRPERRGHALPGVRAGDARPEHAHLHPLRDHRRPERLRRAEAFVASGLRTGAFKPVVDRVFGLEEIGEAHRYMEAGAQIGKIVVTVGH